MGYIIRNGIKYFGDNAVELTQAQYDALPSSKLTDGVDYYITDAQAGTPLATEIAMSTSDNTSVAEAISDLNNRAFTQTQILNTTITTAQDVTIPNFSDYDFVQVIIQGDNNNGIAVFVPTVMFDIPTPFSLYAINNDETFGNYSIHANGIIHNKIVHFNYLKFLGWSKCRIRAYGIKYE